MDLRRLFEQGVMAHNAGRIAEAESAGVVEPQERRMIAGVMRLGDRPVRAVMTPLNSTSAAQASAIDNIAAMAISKTDLRLRMAFSYFCASLAARTIGAGTVLR